VPESPLRFHLLAPEVRCPSCGAGLTFIWVSEYDDLYQCASGGSCKCKVLHYRGKATKTCGYAAIYSYGAPGVRPFGVWTACDVPARR
jgi:hypothetical protein